MQIDYKIINFKEETGQLIVEWHPDFPHVSIDLPIDSENKFPVGKELDTYIRGFVPVWELERIERLKSVTNVDQIVSLVQESSLKNEADKLGLGFPENNLDGLI